MDAKEAVTLAKAYVADLFADEKPMNIGLEEVEFDDSANEWEITLGFSRPWDEPRNAFAAIAGAANVPHRVYKVIRISNGTEEVLSVKNRVLSS